MAEYEYAGPNPVTGEDNEIVHPGDVRDFEQEPDCPPWRLLDPDDLRAREGLPGNSGAIDLDAIRAAAQSAQPVTAPATGAEGGM
jgi:hypothetical protein